jgi:hypothetical protein
MACACSRALAERRCWPYTTSTRALPKIASKPQNRSCLRYANSALSRFSFEAGGFDSNGNPGFTATLPCKPKPMQAVADRWQQIGQQNSAQHFAGVMKTEQQRSVLFAGSESNLYRLSHCRFALSDQPIFHGNGAVDG